MLGHPLRLHGILQNPLYAGEMIYGRLTYRKDPETGVRELHVTPRSEWIHMSMPEWRIVPAEIWEMAQKSRTKHAAHGPHEARRPRHLLSGLLRCGACGGAYTMRSSDCLGCVAHREKGTCNNNRTITLVELERRVLGGLKERLLAPELFAEYVMEFRAEISRLRIGTAERQTVIQKRLLDLVHRIERIVDAISDGTASTSLRARLMDLERQRDRLEQELREVGTTPSLPELPSDLPEIYRRQVAELEATLFGHEVERAAATEILRSLIEGIEVRPGKSPRETTIEVTGSITGILDVALGSLKYGPNRSVGKVVPRGGIEPPTP
jgi:site-specific DNA recombinase